MFKKEGRKIRMKDKNTDLMNTREEQNIHIQY